MPKLEIKKLKNLVIKQQKEINRLKLLVDYDFLTGLYNRRGFVREAEKFLDEFAKIKNLKERRKLFYKNFSLIFIDIDNFKIINDQYGHKIGDKTLKLIAEILRNSAREYDLMGRWGGDEFVIGLVGVSKSNALKISKKLENKIKATKIKGLPLSASFGVVSALDKKEKIFNIYKMIEKADLAMYKEKNKEKNNNYKY